MQYKRVISFGDSFTWGSELSDATEVMPIEIYNNPEKYPKQFKLIKEKEVGPFSSYGLDGEIKSFGHCYSVQTWPALIASYLNADDYYCHARPGMSNAGITRKVIEYIHDYRPTDLLVINWTYISRWEYYDDNEPIYRNAWKSIRPDTQNEIADFYYKHLHNELSEKWSALQQIMLVASTLKQKNIPFIMTCQDSLVLNQDWHATAYIKAAQQEINNDILWFDNRGFYDWAVKHGFPVGDENGHPLEEAHLAAFEYVKENYDFTK